jgi:hypothetical protein
MPRVVTGAAHSGTHVLQFTYGGNPNLADDAWSEQRFVLGAQLSEVLLEWWAFFPADFAVRAVAPNNNKLVILWPTDYSVGSVALIEYQGTGADIVTKYGMAPGVGQFGSAVWRQAFATFRGRWVKFALRVKAASGPGAADGVIQFWADDVLRLDNRALPMYRSPNYFKNGYLMGWANSGFDKTTVVLVDDFTVRVR